MSQFGSKVKIETSELPARRGGGGGGMITELCTPVVVVYPQSRQSDFVQSWGENLFVRDLLETLLKVTRRLFFVFNFSYLPFSRALSLSSLFFAF